MLVMDRGNFTHGTGIQIVGTSGKQTREQGSNPVMSKTRQPLLAAPLGKENKGEDN